MQQRVATGVWAFRRVSWQRSSTATTRGNLGQLDRPHYRMNIHLRPGMRAVSKGTLADTDDTFRDAPRALLRSIGARLCGRTASLQMGVMHVTPLDITLAMPDAG